MKPRVGEGPRGGEPKSCGDPTLLFPAKGEDPTPLAWVGEPWPLPLLLTPAPAGILLCCSALSGLPPTIAARYGSRPEGDGGKDWDRTRLAPTSHAHTGSKAGTVCCCK